MNNLNQREAAQTDKFSLEFVLQDSCSTNNVVCNPPQYTAKQPIGALGIYTLQEVSKILGQVATPSSNTGSKRQNVSGCYKTGQADGQPQNGEEEISPEVAQPWRVLHDWLQGTMEYSDQQTFVDAVEFVVGSFDDTPLWEPAKPKFMGINWQGSGRSVLGIRWGWNPPDQEAKKKGHGFISIPGGVLGSVPARDSWRVCLGLRHRWGFKATRFDAAFDDYEKRVPFETVLEAIGAGNHARFETYDVYYGGGRRKPTGTTIYMGSKKAEKRLTYYDKSVESEGEVDSYRWEARYKGDLAQEAFISYTNVESDQFEELVPSLLGAIVFGAVDFVDKVSGDRLQRRVPLPWWQELTGLFGQLRFSRPRPVRTVRRLLQWHERQVAPSLCALKEGLGDFGFQQYLKGLLASAERRLSDDHKALIMHFKAGRPGTPEYERVQRVLATS